MLGTSSAPLAALGSFHQHDQSPGILGYRQQSGYFCEAVLRCFVG
jgi:hypothetical protein